MRRYFYSILLFAAICSTIVSCDNGKYTANPNSNANGSINPLNPLTASEYTWTGTAPLSCLVNGVPFQADSASSFWQVDTSLNFILGSKGDSQGIELYLTNAYANTSTPYAMGYNNYLNYGVWCDSLLSANPNHYYSSGTNGGFGGVLVTFHDTIGSNYELTGKFYFIGVNPNGVLTTVTDGYFDFKRPR